MSGLTGDQRPLTAGRPSFPFERLKVYGDAKHLAVEVMRLSRSWPREAQFTLAQQIQRAVISVAANLAEGNSRLGPRDQAHFTNMAYASLMEALCHLDLAQEMGWVSEEQTSALSVQAQAIARQLAALHRAQQSRKRGQP